MEEEGGGGVNEERIAKINFGGHFVFFGGGGVGWVGVWVELGHFREWSHKRKIPRIQISRR